MASEKHIELETQIQILQDNVRELQAQLAQAHIRIGELNKDQNEELIKTKQLLQELKFELNSVKGKEAELIQQQMDNIPEVLDSKQILKEGD
tara:strand:- start:557 stop:832 length:276 start_codon:yes stop_codon:yes gene_type:complete